MHPVVHHQKSCSLQLVNETTPSVTAVAPSRVFIISAPPTFNLYDEVTAQKSNNSSINNRIHGAILNPSPSVVGIPINKSYLGEVIPTANMQSTNFFSLGGKLVKRKNWSEEDTKTFIAIWSENYLRLMSGGSRNASIYQSMADELNKILQPSSLTGSEVKAKIGNLIAEYRRKKKELGRTGGSPPTWPYYELVDKILGERPYNDDSLLTDSMNTEDEQVLQDIENIPPIDLNSTQISEPADDLVPSLADTGETNSFTNINPNHLASSSNVDAFSKPNTPPITNSSKPKKTAPGKKETNIGNKSGFDTRSDWENRIL